MIAGKVSNLHRCSKTCDCECSSAGVLLTLTAANCTRDPHVRAARFLEHGKALLRKRDYPRALMES